MRSSKRRTARFASVVIAGGLSLTAVVAAPVDAGTYEGTSGDDVISGSKRDDKLVGHGGNDVLRGGKRHDRLVGGAGDDRLEGGKGSDAYFFGGDFGEDTIIDSAGSADRLVFTKDHYKKIRSVERDGPLLIIETPSGRVTVDGQFETKNNDIEYFQFQSVTLVWDDDAQNLVRPSDSMRAELREEAESAETRAERESALEYARFLDNPVEAERFDREILSGVGEGEITILSASLSDTIKDQLKKRFDPKDFVPRQIAKEILKAVLAPTPLNVGEEEELELDRRQKEFDRSDERRENLEREGHDPSIRDDDFSGDQNTGGNGLL